MERIALLVTAIVTLAGCQAGPEVSDAVEKEAERSTVRGGVSVDVDDDKPASAIVT